MIARLAGALTSGQVTAESLVEQCLEQIALRDASINAFIAVLRDEARAQARDADRAIAAGHYRGPLHGIPVSVKDLFDLQGTATTAASRVRAAHVADRDSLAVARLRQAGAIFVGKTNLHEFAFGTTNEDSAFGLVRHPLDPTRSPGGSSGGSAASVLAGMACASVGTDTGGSIRIPAAACGLVGLKPSLGEIPVDGVVPLSTTMDHVGPIAHSVEDASMLYHAMLGRAPGTLAARPGTDTLRLGVLRGYFTARLDAGVAQAFDQACTRLADAGASLEEVTVPHADDIAPVYLHIVLAEAAAYHAETLETCPEDYTPNVRIRLEMGRYVLAEDYLRALRGRDILRAEVDAALDGRHALLLPALAIPAPVLGSTTVRVSGGDEPIRNLTLRLTQLFNLTGHPALSVPCGLTTEGLPAGLQIVGSRGATDALLDVGRTIERHLDPAGAGETRTS